MAPPMTGRAIGMIPGRGMGRQMYEQLMSSMFGLEVLYSFVIILASLMIYYGTREIYQLSNHKGIKYFRQAFLFFAIAYGVRTFIKFFISYFGVANVFDISLRFVSNVTLFLFVYFSTMAIFYLLYSLVYKKWKDPLILKVFIAVSLAVSLLSMQAKNLLSFLLIVNVAILLFALITGYVAHKKTKKKKHGLYTVYALLFAFFVLNIFDILVPSVLQTFQLLVYLASSGIFLIILYKVLRRVGK